MTTSSSTRLQTSGHSLTALCSPQRTSCSSHPNTIARESLEILFDEIDTLEDKFDDVQITTVAAVLNEVSHDGLSSEVQQWFVDTFGERSTYSRSPTGR